MIKRTSLNHINSLLKQNHNWKVLDIGCGYSANPLAETICDVIDLSNFYKDKNPKTASIVPIAFPLIAGPGTLTTLISIRSEYDKINIILAIIINMIIVYMVLKSSEKIEKILGSQGIHIIRKVFGIILLAIGIKLFTTNIKLIFS